MILLGLLIVGLLVILMVSTAKRIYIRYQKNVSFIRETGEWSAVGGIAAVVRRAILKNKRYWFRII